MVNIDFIPGLLQKELAARFQRVDEKLSQVNSDWQQSYFAKADLEKQLLNGLLGSTYLTDFICTYPEKFLILVKENVFWDARQGFFYQKALDDIAKSSERLSDFGAKIRKFRQQEMLRFIWREINSIGRLDDSLAELSDFASVCIEQSLSYLYQELVKDFGEPLSEAGAVQQLSVIAMGKLGGGELNLSSDIDLIFFYAEKGRTSGKRALDNQQFFTRLAQALIKVLDERTVEGFVFRVDMRLRPYGDSGQLVLTQSAMEQYYETQGRAWERYAFVKAKVLAGDVLTGEQFMKTIKPFVYRRYLDFSVIESLREMKSLINRQVKSKGVQDDVKLGEGGIRELEFIVQALQLIQGGKNSELQKRSYFGAMEAVAKMGFMSRDDADALLASYRYLRKVEHLLQAYADKQTQMLPQDEFEQAALAFLMGHDHWASFYEELSDVKETVRASFNELFGHSQVEVTAEAAPLGTKLAHYEAFWRQAGSSINDIEGILSKTTLSDEMVSEIKVFASERALQSLPELERKRLDQLIPILLLKLEKLENAEKVLARFLKFTRVVLKRSAYLVLLLENSPVFDRLLFLFSESEWVLEQIIKHPFLLDELLGLEQSRVLPEQEALASELRQQLLRISPDDLESQTDAFRIFKKAHEIRVASLYLNDEISTFDLGEYLSSLADVILSEVCALASHLVCEMPSVASLIAEHSEKSILTLGALDPLEHFAVLAYGKLGSREMGFGSDLDLVFLYEIQEDSPFSEQFYIRMGQKIIHLLSVRTYNGRLYEVDMRLRPSGKSGPIVSTVNAFQKYQQKSAWTWEHQALIKARVLSGNSAITKRIQVVREAALLTKRKSSELLADITEMRIRLSENFAREKQSLGVLKKDDFHLKSSQGAIVDIEFIAQYLVLRYAHEYPELINCRATLEVFECAKKVGFLNQFILTTLRDAYLEYRGILNRMTLQQNKIVVSRSKIEPHPDNVKGFWRQLSLADNEEGA